jgi:hypothetical protein
VLYTHDPEMRIFGGGGQDRSIGGRRSDVKALGARVSGVPERTAAKDDTVRIHSEFDAYKGDTETLLQ